MKVELTMDQMLRLPWGWRGPVEVRAPEGDVHFELRIQELPDFFLAAPTRDQVLAECVEALGAFLQSYADHQEVPPLPIPPVPTWQVGNPLIASLERVPEARRPEEPVLVTA
jgi:hypothetical protein